MQVFDAFGIVRGARVALVGGGGKTTLRDVWVREARARGWSVLATTTTKSVPPEGVAAVIEEDPLRRTEWAREALGREGAVFVAAHAEGSRFTGVDPIWLKLAAADLVVVEADGSRKKPLKAPSPYEPVIPASSTLVVAVIGAEAIGATADEALVHRLGIFSAVTGLKAGDELPPDALARFIESEEGYRKDVPEGAAFVPFINKVSRARPGAVEALVAALKGPRVVWGEAKEGRFESREG